MTRHREFFQITHWARRYDKRTGKFTISISYKTKTDVTDRTTAVAEAFGLGIDEDQRHILYDNVQLKITPTDIVYITGESGSGKSTLLKTLEKDITQSMHQTAINIAHIQPDPEKPLIDTVGKTFEEGLELLSRVGLNDAFLFVRRYNQLSDGQKYRYRLAKLLESKRQYWIMDEFCATLDRDTAKIVAYNIQKLARQENKAVIAATTHRPTRRPKTLSPHPQKIRKRNHSQIPPQQNQQKMHHNQRNAHHRRHKTRLQPTRRIPLPQPQNCQHPQNLQSQTQRRNMRRNRLLLPTRNLLRTQNGPAKNEHARTEPESKHHQPRHCSPKIPNHRIRPKTRTRNTTISWHTPRRNRSSHGQIQPLLRKSRHAQNHRKPTSQNSPQSSKNTQNTGLQHHFSPQPKIRLEKTDKTKRSTAEHAQKSIYRKQAPPLHERIQLPRPLRKKQTLQRGTGNRRSE